jgi:hypothetical protein
VSLEQLRGGGRFVVELGNLTVALWIVVVRVDDNLARQRLDRHRPVRFEWHTDHDNVAGFRRFLDSGGARVRSELANQFGKAVRVPRVAQDDTVTVRHSETRELAADVASADEANDGHGTNIV